MSKARARSWISLVCVSSLASCAPPAPPEPGTAPGLQYTEWRVNHGDAAASRYAPLSQVNASNVSELREAWLERPLTAPYAALSRDF